MPGPIGPLSEPKSQVRARRNAAFYSSNFSSILGDGLEISGGLIAIKVQDPIFADSDGVGLNFGEGLELDSGDPDSLRAKIQDPVLRDGSGIGLNYDDNAFSIVSNALALDTQSPVFVDTSGIGVNTGNGITISGTDLIAVVQVPAFLDGSGIGILYDDTTIGLDDSSQLEVKDASLTEAKMAAAATQTLGVEFQIEHNDKTTVALTIPGSDVSSNASEPILPGSVVGQELLLIVVGVDAFPAVNTATLLAGGSADLHGNWIARDLSDWIRLKWLTVGTERWREIARGVGINIVSGLHSAFIGGSLNECQGLNNVCLGGTDNLTTNNNTACIGGNDNDATGVDAICIGGHDNNATDVQTACIGGIANSATGATATCCGGNRCTASGQYSMTSGNRCKALLYGQVAWAGGLFAAIGDAQATHAVAKIATASDAPAVLFLGTTSRHTIASGRTHSYRIHVVAREDDGLANGGWEFGIVIKRNGATTSQVGTTQLVWSSVEGDLADDSVVVSADDTNDALEIEVTGLDGRPIRWVANIDTVEVGH